MRRIGTVGGMTISVRQLLAVCHSLVLMVRGQRIGWQGRRERLFFARILTRWPADTFVAQEVAWVA